MNTKSVILTALILFGFNFLLCSVAGATDDKIFPKSNVNCQPAGDILNALKTITKQDKIHTIKHRGDFSAGVPENSLSAFNESAARCRQAIEVDVRRTKDNHLVVFHDEKIGKLLLPAFRPLGNIDQKNPAIADMTFSELHNYDFVNIETREVIGGKVPSVEQMIKNYIENNHQYIIYFDVKQQATPELLAEINRLNSDSIINPKKINLFERVVFKMRLSEYPYWSDWLHMLSERGLVIHKPLVYPWISNTVNKQLDSVKDKVKSYSEHFIGHEGNPETGDYNGAVGIEIVMKDSSGYLSGALKTKQYAGNKKIIYFAPPNDRATIDESLASIVEYARSQKFPIGNFAAIPDFMLWKKNVNYQTAFSLYVRNVDPDSSLPYIPVEEAYYENNGLCCYTAQESSKRLYRSDKAGNDVELVDQRFLPQWLVDDVGYQYITSDDIDSVQQIYPGKLIYPADTYLPPDNSIISLNKPRIPYDMANSRLETLYPARLLQPLNSAENKVVVVYNEGGTEKQARMQDNPGAGPFLSALGSMRVLFFHSEGMEIIATNKSYTLSSMNPLCLNETQQSFQYGHIVNFSPCKGSLRQKWSYSPSNHAYINVETSLCLDSNVSQSPNNNLFTYTCNNTVKQQWNELPKGIEKFNYLYAYNGIEQGDSRRKFVLARTTNNSQARVEEDNGTDVQDIIYKSNGQILTSAKECLYENINNHNVFFGNCNSNYNTSVWLPYNNNALMNYGTKRCLDVQSIEKGLITYECNGNINQKWKFPYANVHFEPMEIRSIENKIIYPTIGSKTYVFKRNNYAGSDTFVANVRLSDSGGYDKFLIQIPGQDYCFAHNAESNKTFINTVSCNSVSPLPRFYKALASSGRAQEIIDNTTDNCLDKDGGGEDLISYGCHGGENQQWFTPFRWKASP